MPISWIAVQQRRVGEEAARRHPEMLAKGVAEPGRRDAVAREAHVDAPQQERQPLAEMAEDDLEPRIRVEHAAQDQPDALRRGLDREPPGGAQDGRELARHNPCNRRRSPPGAGSTGADRAARRAPAARSKIGQKRWSSRNRPLVRPCTIAPLKPSRVTARSSSSAARLRIGGRQRGETGEAVGMGRTVSASRSLAARASRTASSASAASATTARRATAPACRCRRRPSRRCGPGRHRRGGR